VDRLTTCAPESAHLARLDGRQQLYLQGVGQLADLVEEERALMRGLDQPSLGNPRVGEGSTLEPEQLRLEQCRGNRGAVDVDERPGGPSPRPVEESRDESLSRAGLAEQQHGRQAATLRALSQPPHLRSQVVERSATSDQLGERKASGHSLLPLPRRRGAWSVSDAYRPIGRSRPRQPLKPREMSAAESRAPTTSPGFVALRRSAGISA